MINLESAVESCDPGTKDFEVVERKGLGHPDTLADGLAESISNEYSRYCLDRWGAVLHHNLDKLYIGAGHWEVGYGIGKMKKPVQVRINGRISSSFENNKIDTVEIQRRAVASYLGRVMPNIKLDENLVIDHNATQHTIRKNWFEPQSREDLPELAKLTANDTAICVAHAPLTPLEKLCLKVEQYFWVLSSNGSVLKPKLHDVGQDIKVMGVRKRENIEIFVCFPLISSFITSPKAQKIRSEEIENDLNVYIKSLIEFNEFNIHLSLTNRYLLALGSCIECGEEGLVGRGNGLSGLISIMRPKGNEAYFGKNPMYHVGRVQMFLTKKYSSELYKMTGLANTVYTLGVHSTDLIPPKKTQVYAEQEIDPTILQTAASKIFTKENYLQSIIGQTLTDNFHEKYV